MKTKDYAHEVGLDSREKRISWPIALVILLVLVGITWFGLSRLGSTRSTHGTAAPTPAAAPADPVNRN